MGKLRLVEKGSGYVEKLDLPDFYMNDFSVMGLVVGDVEAAAELLTRTGYTLEEKQEQTWVCFAENREVNEMVSLLTENNIAGALSDIMSCAYQG